MAGIASAFKIIETLNQRCKLKLSIITTCKGRLEHLKQTLPVMVEQGNEVEVIVVDYDCPDGTAAWVAEHYPSVHVVKVEGAPTFSISKARNLGAAQATADWFFFIDADTLIPPDFAPRIFPLLSAGNFYHPHVCHSNAFGSFICARDDFFALDGYDEVLRPWGGEDRDIYYRLRNFLNRSNPGFPGEWLTPILHSNADRLRFTEATSVEASGRANALYLMVKFDLCRLAGKYQLSVEMRQSLYETIRKQVLTDDANGVLQTKFELDASKLPGFAMPSCWRATRKLQYEIFFESGADQALKSTQQSSGSVAATQQVSENSGQHKPAGRIVMFHIGRCGSTVLGDLLNQHPVIEWDGEIYEPKGRFYHKHGFNGDATDPVGFLKKRLDGAKKSNYGFEIKPYQARLIGMPIEKLVRSLDALKFSHFVLLQRRNSLRKVVSSMVGRSSGRMHVPAGSAVSLSRIHLNVNDVGVDHEKKTLVEFLRGYETDMRDIECRLAGRNVLQLKYEDDLEADPQVGYFKVCDFLGIAPAPVETKLGRTTPFPLSDVLKNYDEVAATLRGTEFEWMIV